METDPVQPEVSPPQPPPQPTADEANESTATESISVVIRQKGVAPLKKEFIVELEKLKKALGHQPQEPHDDEGVGATEARGGKEGAGKKQNRQKRARGEVEGGQEEERMCHAYLADKCNFGDKCKFSHDVQSYLRRKPEDLGPFCPVYEANGVCQMSVLCRWARSHTTQEGKNLERPEAEGGVKVMQSLNTLSKDTMILLRKNKFPFKTQRAKDREDNYKKKGKKDSENKATAMEAEGANGDGNNPVAVVENGGKTDGEGGFNSTLLPEVEKRTIDFRNKVYVAPLTTVGNLPFRRVMKKLGADITCGEMALGLNLLHGQQSEWALLRRHPSEDVFGVQIAGGHADQMGRVAELLQLETKVDFVDLNMGCPIDLVCEKGMGSALMTRMNKLSGIVHDMTPLLGGVPMTIKMRTGIDEKKPIAHNIVPHIQQWVHKDGCNVAAVMIHGRSRQQRYTKTADWEYIKTVADSQDNSIPRIPVIGNGDIMSWTDFEKHKATYEGILEPCAMLARGALIKPWLPTEIKEQRHWDISASERLDILKSFVSYGLENWGSDQRGINVTRRFLLEWLSFLYRYIPVGLLEVLPQHINDRPPYYVGRSDLETLLSSPFDRDWIKISEMLLGPVPEGFRFEPKHKANSYS